VASSGPLRHRCEAQRRRPASARRAAAAAQRPARRSHAARSSPRARTDSRHGRREGARQRQSIIYLSISLSYLSEITVRFHTISPSDRPPPRDGSLSPPMYGGVGQHLSCASHITYTHLHHETRARGIAPKTNSSDTHDGCSVCRLQRAAALRVLQGAGRRH
jgi:hypothetical protein